MKIKTKKILKAASKRIVVITMVAGLIFSSGSFLTNKTAEKAQADSSDTSVTVANASPTTGSVSIDSDASNVTLTENITTNVICETIVSDNNGFADITSVEARLYETSQGATGTADENYRYILTGDAECVPSGGAGNSETYTCTFAVQFFANPADNWTCLIAPSDSDGDGSTGSDTIIVDALNALNVVAGIAYGNMGVGTDSGSSPIATLVTNTGNIAMDPQVSSGADMTCATGTIIVANQKYAASTFTYSSGGVALSGTPTTLNLNLPKPTSTTPVNDKSYWGILIPGSGVDGACTGANTFTATTG